MTALAEGQVYETDFDKRVELFQELELLVSREIPIIVIANQSSYSMYRKDVYDGWMKTYATSRRSRTACPTWRAEVRPAGKGEAWEKSC